jgi:hypothetical protein
LRRSERSRWRAKSGDDGANNKTSTWRGRTALAVGIQLAQELLKLRGLLRGQRRADAIAGLLPHGLDLLVSLLVSGLELRLGVDEDGVDLA